MSNFPTNYNRFIRLAKTIKDHQYRSKKTASSLTRACARYNLAKSFKGMNCDGIGKYTVLGYDAITKLFLAYCSYELMHDSARILLNYKNHEEIRPLTLTAIFGDDTTVTGLRNNEVLKTFVLKHIDKKWWVQNELDKTIVTKFFNGGTKDIHLLTRTLRNWFAHGNLTATPIGPTAKDRKSIDRLTNCILKATDDMFQRCLTKF